MADKRIVVEFDFLSNQGVEAIEQTKKAILELKTERKKLRLQGKEESKEYILMDAQLKNLNKTLKSQQSALEANLKAIEANDGSLKSMREQLKSLVTAYDNLSKTERESESGQALAQRIATLTKDIKDLEYETERYQRNVGNYGNSIQEALSIDTTPLKTQLRSLTQELQNLTLQQRQLRESMKDMTDPEEIAATEKKIDELGAAIQDTANKAGTLKDTMEDTGKVISARADDYPAITALNEGITALIDSYTVLKGVTTALGLENDRLLDVMAKIQVLQQSVNALNRIAIALDKAKNGALAIQQTSFYKLVVAKMADRKASIAQAKANATLTASEGAATVGAGALRKALIALKASFMSIPGIGWIAAAAAAITALTVKIVKARKEAKEMAQDFDMQINGLSNIDKQAVVTKSNLLAMADAAMSAAQGSKEQEYWVRQVAQQTGVSYEYLKDHLDIMPQLIEKYAQLAYAQDLFKRSMEMSGEIADTSAKLQEFWTKIQSIGGSGKTYIENIKKAMESVTDETVKQSRTFKTLQQQVEYYKKDADGLRLTIRGSAEELGSVAQIAKSEIKDLQEEQDKILDKAKKNSEEAGTFMADIQKKAGASITKTNQTTTKAIESLWDKLYTRTLPAILKKYDEETSKTLADMVKSGVDAGTQALYAAQRYLGRANVMDTFAKETKTMLADVSKDITALFDLIGNLQQKRAMEFGAFRIEKRDLDAKDRENLAKMMEKTLDIIAGYEPKAREKMTDLLGFSGASLEDLQAKINSLDTPEEFLDFIKQFREGVRDLNREVQNGTTDIDKANSIVLKDIQDSLSYLKKIKELSQEVLPAVRDIQLAFSKLDTSMDDNLKSISTELNNVLAEIYGDLPRNLAQDAEIQVRIQAKIDETAMAKAQLALDTAKSKLQELENTPAEIRIQWGEGFDRMLEEAKSQVAQAEMDINKIQYDARVKNMKSEEEFARARKQLYFETYQSIGQAAGDSFGTLSGLFDQLAEKDSRYAKYSKAFALMQILTSTAVSIASAIQGATTAGAATGPAAVATTPAFIVEMISIVLSAIAQATSILAQAKMPHYAEGGYVNVGTGPKSDNVHAMVSKGEYIMQADAVKRYGKDYFDSLNAGLVRGNMDITNALKAALKDMPSPVVSVKEINNMQSRVRVKESISRQ